MADLLAFLATENLLSLRDELQARANAGDADAAKRLSSIYDECAGVYMVTQALAQTPQPPSGTIPGGLDARDPHRLAALSIGQQRCRGIIPVADPRSITSALFQSIRAMNTLAGNLGYPGILPLDSPGWHEPARLAEWSRGAAARLLNESTPESFLSLADSVAGLGTPYSASAWLLVACDFGYPCATQTPYMRDWCAQFGTQCGSAGRLEFAREQSTPRDWRQAQVQRAEILEHLRNGRVDALISPHEDDDGGGG